MRISFDIRAAANAIFVALAVLLPGCDPVAEVPVWGTLPDFSLINQGAEPYGEKPEAFAAFIREESVKWSQVVKASGAVID